MNEKLVFISENTVTIDYICSVLKENNIPYVKKIEGAGEYLTIATGNLFNNPIKIFVSEKDFEKASELIKMINETSQEKETDEIPEELQDVSQEEEKEMEKEAEKTKRYLKLFIICFIFIPIAIAIILAIAIGILES